MRPLVLFAIYSVTFASVTIIRATADANNPAHELAQKFAAEGEPKAETVKTNPAEPAEAQPIATKPNPTKPNATKTVVANPANAKPAPSTPSPANVANPKPAPSVTPATLAPPAAAPAMVAPKLAQAKPARPPAPGPDYEKDMLDAARAEAEARQQTQTKQPEPKQPEPTAPPVAMPAAAAPASAQAAVQPQTAAAPEPAPTPAATPQIKIEAKVSSPAPSAPAVVPRPEGAPRATILAVLTQHASNGARAITPPDPIICLDDICYISAGPIADAKLISRAEALSTKNTVTSGAGACKGVNRCAFRGVSMKPGDEIQIIDLGLVGHDKREPADVTPDKSCRVDAGDLVCDHPVAAPDYRIWVVPEAVAAAAGPGAIEAALADDLPEEDVARADDK